jgi:hypothetical protein
MGLGIGMAGLGFGDSEFQNETTAGGGVGARVALEVREVELVIKNYIFYYNLLLLK